MSYDLVITLTGDSEDDLVFLRDRSISALEDIIAEYEANLDGDVDVSWDEVALSDDES